jgi:radical SAM superfamily enzyme YgiQ (UPF0313 family)
MQLILINPCFPYAGSDKFPLGLAYIAGIAQKFHIDVTVIDENIGDELHTGKIATADLIGLTITTPAYPRALEIIKICNENRKRGSLLFCGGHHPTFCAEALFDAGIDLVFREEADISFTQFLDAILINKPWTETLGISYHSPQKQIIHNPFMPLISDLDSIPFPAWSPFSIAKYPVLSVTTSRGCPYHCSYCAAAQFWHNQIRYRSIANVLAEIDELLAFTPVKEIKFQDSVFTMNKTRTKALLNQFIAKKYTFSWSCETRADVLDFELIQLMQKSGCKSIMVGLESGSQSVLDLNNRKMNIASFIDICHTITHLGIGLRISVIFGLPSENSTTVEETLTLLKKISPNVIFLNLATIYPGCTLETTQTIQNHPQWIADFKGHGRGGQQILPKNMTPHEYRKLATYMKNEIHKLNTTHWM